MPKSKRKAKRLPRPLPEPIPDTPENIAKAILDTPPKAKGEWKYLQGREKAER